MRHHHDKANSGHKAAMAEVRQVVAEAKELSAAADGALTDKLATWVAGRYAIATRQLADNGELDWKLLRNLCHDLVDLRRGDHSAESLRIERERWEAEQAEKKADLEKQFWDWAKKNQDDICRGFKTQAEKLDLLREALFGEAVPDGPPPQRETANGCPNCQPESSNPIQVVEGG